MSLCPRHDDALHLALELRGCLRPTLTDAADLMPLNLARGLLVEHAEHFAGHAAIQMLAEALCPVCFVNMSLRRTHPGLTVDDWVDHAADDALALECDTHTVIV